MATDPSNGGGTVKELLSKVTQELDAFEAKKLVALKAELEAFVKKKDALDDEYEKKYPVLRERWCTQHQAVQGMYESLQHAFPTQDWKELIRDCVCSKQRETDCLELRISKRRYCMQGKRERARDDAKAALDTSRVRLEALNANAQKVDAALIEGDKLIKDIQSLVPGPDKAVALFLFWFKLLPLHLSLMPEDVAAECKELGKDETPWLLCKVVLEPKCDDDDPCDAKGYTPPDRGGVKSPRPAPWLMPWQSYSGCVDSAWQDYRKKKDALAVVELEFKGDPDDLDSLRKKLDELKKSFEGHVKDCLQQKKPEDKSCPPGAGEAAQAKPEPGESKPAPEPSKPDEPATQTGQERPEPATPTSREPPEPATQTKPDPQKPQDPNARAA